MSSFKEKIARVTEKIIELAREKGKNEVPIAELAFELDMSPHYLKYFVLKYAVQLNPCIEIAGDNVKIKEKCQP